jgi:hypothetical protein
MLWVIVLIALMALACGAAGYWVGHTRASKEIADRLQKDPDCGKAVLEQLAHRWGAKLEMFSIPATPGEPPSNG